MTAKAAAHHGQGHTAKHAGSQKHAGTNKHHPAAKKPARKKTPPHQQATAHHPQHPKAQRKQHPHKLSRAESRGRAGITPFERRERLDGPAAWDLIPCCAALALAASARMAGLPVSDADALAVYGHAAAHENAGASILATLEAACEYGIGGYFPVSFAPVVGLVPDGSLVGTTLEAGRHAVTVDGDGVWTWGQWHPWACGYLPEVEQAWSVRWLS